MNFHSSPISAARHIERIWDSVPDWWESDSVQEARIRFCRKYSFLPDNMCERIKTIITKISQPVKRKAIQTSEKGQDYSTFLNPNDVAKYVVFAISFDGNIVSEEILLKSW